MTALTRFFVRGVDLVNRRGKSVGVRLVRLTGQRAHAIHPKHLMDHPWHDWYLPHWKREAAMRRPEKSTGFRVVARKRG